MYFLQKSKKDERSKFLTKVDKDSNWYDKIGIQVKGKEGLVVEKPDILDKYCRMHKSCGKICPSQFAKIYESTSKVPKKYLTDEENYGDEHDTDEDDGNLEEELGGNHEHNNGTMS